MDRTQPAGPLERSRASGQLSGTEQAVHVELGARPSVIGRVRTDEQGRRVALRTCPLCECMCGLEVHLDDEDRVLAFEEKPRLDHWVNGGFFVFEPAFLDYLEDDSVLENSPLRRLAADRELHAFRHTGFWDCMDTYKDAVTLNDLWTAGDAPWAVWERSRTADARV